MYVREFDIIPIVSETLFLLFFFFFLSLLALVWVDSIVLNSSPLTFSPALPNVAYPTEFLKFQIFCFLVLEFPFFYSFHFYTDILP